MRIRSHHLHKGYEVLIPKAKCDAPCNPNAAEAEAEGPRVQGPPWTAKQSCLNKVIRIKYLKPWGLPVTLARQSKILVTSEI